MKEYANIKDLMAEIEKSNFGYYGFRNTTEKDIEIIESGRDYLDVSHDWIDNVCTEDELSGTSAIYIDSEMNPEEIKSRYEQCLQCYCGNTIILIADNAAEWGEDENEVLLGSNGYGAYVIGYVKL